MGTHLSSIPRWGWALLALLLVAVAAALTSDLWQPWLKRPQPDSAANAAHPDEDPHAGHEHAGHSESTSIELSQRGLKNIGFRALEINFGSYVKSLTLPAIVVERPGRSQLHITAPLTGVVTKIYIIEGAAVPSDAPMFDVRLTHEELVTTQSELLRTAESLEIVNAELARLKSVAEGVIPAKRVLEQEYEKQKLESALRAGKQALILHGLNQEHIDSILQNRQLVHTLTVRAPEHRHDTQSCREEHMFHVQSLPVTMGQHVETGETLCVLADHCELYVEGRAFADDAVQLRQALVEGWEISASLLVGDREAARIDGLRLLYLADHIDPESRAYRFYLSLPNEVATNRMGTGDETENPGHRFLEWRYKPGQRMELQVPVAVWEQRIVLPVEAVVDEGAETYVYRQNGDHFDQVPVHVEYRGQHSVVVANDGALFPGDVVAGHGAYQMHLALKNKSGGGIDPHAGHSH